MPLMSGTLKVHDPHPTKGLRTACGRVYTFREPPAIGSRRMGAIKTTRPTTCKHCLRKRGTRT